ncbi:putative N6-adenine-specific DNA methylase [Bernardetia litoralis DSM 6794]|uniref:Putative N6-adenine-specific DNA methylase n=1 Tax=Bernardetia litoralis (strain ATCC 23117 / DSM 6794 / NBRC 15988 / NCIMB 1366 / Fx l1 / Sio-4) TaxID=880071 RepID=I4ANH2_BERLS|nr:methyltransferase domain-containing protein [Bernardetia litoralis]AFM05507.1 putative N6-adenine-specific DNA methylase [Bernardetia litoralis DSM 6794]
MKKYVVTCDYNLEDLVIEEIRQKITEATEIQQFENFSHRVSFIVPNSDKETNHFILQKILSLRSIHSVVELKGTFYLENTTLENLKAKVMEIDLPELKTAKSFRASAERYGTHDFTSIEMAKHIGHTIILRYQIPVSLTEYEYNVRVDVIGNFVFVGYQITDDTLAHRKGVGQGKYNKIERSFHHRAATKHTLAYHLLTLAGLKEGDSLLDCTCGGGTIVLEAASMFGDKIKILAGDMHEKAIEGTKENLKLNNFDFVETTELNARHLNETIQDYVLKNGEIDKIVCNLPFGIQSGKQVNMRGLYDQFLSSAAKILSKNGKIVVLTMRQGVFREVIFMIKKYKITKEYVTEAGGLYLHIFVIEKI